MTESNTPSEPDDPGAANAPQGSAHDQPGVAHGQHGISSPSVKSGRAMRISWIWLVPAIAVLVGLSLLVKGWMHAGPTVTISFESADGIEVGQTKVRYKDVVIGSVSKIRVADDRSKVLVDAQLNREGAKYITQKDTRFWVVRPRLGISGVSGLGTLLSGAYISVDAPKAIKEGSPVYEFAGLEKPPEITNDRPGRRFTLKASDLGSIELGSPVYYRRIQVGRIIGYDLDPKGEAVNVQIFIDAPNDKFVTSDARFWNASGIDLSLNTSGVSVKTGSLASVIAGGIAFASANEKNRTPAPADSTFKLGKNESAAMADPDGEPFRVDLIFDQSVRGLKVGAPVEFRGMELGSVYDIDLEFDSERRRFYVLVKTNLYPRRFGAAYKKMSALDKNAAYPGQHLLGPMVKRGLRAQLQASNLLTGQQFIALDFVLNAPPVEFDSNKTPVQLPTIPGNFDRLQQQLGSIVAKIDALPFAGISNDLRASLKSVTKALNGLDSKITPQAASTLRAAQRSLDRVDALLAQDSPMQNNLDRTLQELSSAAKSLRSLGDYLQANPAALIRGRPADVLPGSH